MSDNRLANPLQALLSRAATTLPARSEEMDRARRRHGDAGDAVVIVCDCSGSMDSTAWGGRRKIDVLRAAVADCWCGQRIVCFSGGGVRAALRPEEIPEPAGGTPLDAALASIAPARPRHTLVISDGQPDDEAAALAAADRLTGVIDVLYVGPDGDAAAISFMRRLARAGGGRVVVSDVTRADAARSLAQSVRAMLPAPRDAAPGGGR